MSGPAESQTEADQPWVLLVEDDPQVSLAIRWTLEAEGIAVDAAPTARHALELAARRPPRPVLLDIDLPDASGHSVADALRAAHGNLPILVVTADRAAEKAARAGAFAFQTLRVRGSHRPGYPRRALTPPARDPPQSFW